MMRRQTISSRRSCLLWLGLLLALALAAAVAAVVFVIAPQQAEQRALARATAEANARQAEATRTAEAEGAEIERLYQAGLTFQTAGRRDDAIAAFSEVIRRAPDYRDAAGRLAALTAQLSAAATATAQAAPTVTAEALAGRYRRGQGLVNLKQWLEAQAELQTVFDADPDYPGVQPLLATVNAEVARLPPTATPTATPTPTSTSTHTPTATPTFRYTPTATATPTPTATATATFTPRPPTATPDLTGTAAFQTAEAIRLASPTPTRTATPTPHLTATAAVATAQAFATAQAIAAARATAIANPPAALRQLAQRFGLEFVYVPAGEFIMGSPDGEGKGDEHPQHTIALDGFRIGKTEITNAQYRPFVEAGGYRDRSLWTAAGWQWREERNVTQPGCWDDERWNKADYPVVCVSWYEAVAYANWLSRVTGLSVRLPTEAEWEKAARGSDGRTWPWGNEAPDGTRLNSCDVNCEYGWRDSAVDDGYRDTAPAGSYPAGASPYGALDMAGNVWEWTSSLDKDYPYRSDDGRENLEGSECCRVVRGGAWFDLLVDAHPANRYRNTPGSRDDLIGVRLVVAPQ